MDNTYWQKQENEPLFPDVFWSRPEHASRRGKLLIIGGNRHEFSAVAQSYTAALSAGVGECRAVMPSALKKTIPDTFYDAHFVPSTASGGISKGGLNELKGYVAWSDAVLLPGDLGKNSETASVVLELLKTNHALCLTKDAIDLLQNEAAALLGRENTLLVASVAQLQRLARATGEQTPITLSSGLVQMVERLHAFSLKWPSHIVTNHLNTILCASGGRVTSTKTSDIHWRARTAAWTIVFVLQHARSQGFESIATGLWASLKD